MMKYIGCLIFSLFIISVKAQVFIEQPRSSSVTPNKWLPAKEVNLLDAKPTSPAVKKTKAEGMIEITTSANIYGVLYPEVRTIAASPATSLLAFIHRGNPAVAGLGKTSGSIVASLSGDLGYSWGETLFIDDSIKKNRHPSIALFDAVGNLDPLKTLVGFTGPVTDDVFWVENYFGVKQVNLDFDTVFYASTPDQLIIKGMTSCSDSSFHMLGLAIDTNAAGDIIDVSGIVNTLKLELATQSVSLSSTTLHPNFLKDKNGYAMTSISVNQAWSVDGKVGYVFFIGVDSASIAKTYQPIVFKTQDGGSHWQQMPDQVFSTIPTINKYLLGTRADTSLKKAFFTNETISGLVDYNQDLHIFSQISYGASDHPDSLSYYYGPLLLFDVFTTSDSTWDASVISLLQTVEVSEKDRLFGSAGAYLGWDHRLQMARNANATTLFFIWADSDPTFASRSWDNTAYINDIPNIYGYAKDVSSNLVTPIYIMTANSGAAYNAYWHNVSEQVFEVLDGYVVPTVITPILTQYALNPDQPVTHYYLDHIAFALTDFSPASIEETAKQAIAVTTYPNPFTDSFTLSLSMDQPSNLVVELFDVLGQKVFQQEYPAVYQGLNQIEVNVNNLPQGLYIYRVTTPNHSIGGRLFKN